MISAIDTRGACIIHGNDADTFVDADHEDLEVQHERQIERHRSYANSANQRHLSGVGQLYLLCIIQFTMSTIF